MAVLRPRARIIRTIGDQLISGPEAALIELVKNGYDADSPKVWLKIQPPDASVKTGRIVVKDEGHGMTYNDVVNRWFEPATEDKLKREFSPEKHRRMLGAKGIGRFAASRLGAVTTVRSIAKTKAGRLEEVSVKIDWNAFTADRYLDELDVPVTRHNPSGRPLTGVELTIEELRDEWTSKKLQGLIRELRRLAAPPSNEDSFEIHLDVTAFTEEKNGFDGSELLRKLNVDLGTEEDESGADATLIRPFRVQEFSDYSLQGSFDEGGNFKGTFTVLRGDGKPQEMAVPAPVVLPDERSCGPVEVTINVYDRETEAVEALFERMGLDLKRIGIRAARQILTDNAGISIFRSGFRIRPYGEPENDWLELERQRVQNPSRKLGLSQVAGRVIIVGEQQSGLIERSSREGLEHNGSFDRLKRLMHEVLTHVEERRFSFRESAGISRRVEGDLTRARSLAKLPAVSSAASTLPSPHASTMQKAIESDSASLSATFDEIEAYQTLLQSRATLGFVVAKVLHDGRRFLSPIATSARLLNQQKDELTEKTKLGDVARKQLPDHVKAITDASVGLAKLFKQLDPISGKQRGRPSTIKVHESVDSALNLLAEKLTENEVTVRADIPQNVVAYGYPEDLQAALMNILDNAAYWLGTTENRHRTIWVNAKNTRESVEVVVMNNGPQVDPAYFARLFSVGFTLKTEGLGLGLAIAREACRRSKGELRFDENAEDTTFIIQFPRVP